MIQLINQILQLMKNKINYPHYKDAEVQLNRDITLKLEDDRINIYVSGEMFKQCKSLIFNILIAQLDAYSKLISIDDIEQPHYKEKRFSINYPWLDLS